MCTHDPAELALAELQAIMREVGGLSGLRAGITRDQFYLCLNLSGRHGAPVLVALTRELCDPTIRRRNLVRAIVLLHELAGQACPILPGRTDIPAPRPAGLLEPA